MAAAGRGKGDVVAGKGKAVLLEKNEAGVGAGGEGDDEVMKPPEASSVDIRIAMIGNVDRCVFLRVANVGSPFPPNERTNDSSFTNLGWVAFQTMGNVD